TCVGCGIRPSSATVSSDTCADTNEALVAAAQLANTSVKVGGPFQTKSHCTSSNYGSKSTGNIQRHVRHAPTVNGKGDERRSERGGASAFMRGGCVDPETGTKPGLNSVPVKATGCINRQRLCWPV